MDKHFVAGYGEVGKALVEILKADYCDKGGEITKADVLHIAFPYFEGFEDEVKKYQKETEANLTIIHSTVPVGTSRRCNAVHSPVRGVHPNLVEGINTFVKFFGGDRAKEASKYFNKTIITPNPETTELGKILDTTYYGLCIAFNKEAHRLCEEHNADFDIAYTQMNQTYNEGYKKLGRPEVVRPTLTYMEGKIGGHCVVPNLRFIPDTKMAKYIIDNGI